MNIKSITSLTPADLKSKRVLVRVDFNVQVYEGKIMDDLRIRKTLPTISFLRQAGAKIILISHIESKDGTGLRPIADHVNAEYRTECGEVLFVPNFLNESSREVCNGLAEGQVALFENLRIDPREKENDPEFSKYLAGFADIYVNDAFAVSHRPHASVVGVPELFPDARYAGVQLMSELENLKIAFNPPHPFIFILGGAKFETKLPLIEKFSKHADKIYLGGALLNDILKAKGYNVGKSLVSSNAENGASEQFDLATIVANPKLVIPTDVVVEDENGASTVVGIDSISEHMAIMDVGPSFTEMLRVDLAGVNGAEKTQFVLWNGPMGNYEKGFRDQTVAMAEVVFESGIQAALGGGDTTAAIKELGYEEKSGNIFVSTGGGAMLEYLENETLPGVEALV